MAQRRLHGWPKKPRMQEAIRSSSVPKIDSTCFACLGCSTLEGPAEKLPVYCEHCYKYSLLYRYNDPTEDLAVVHYVYWGPQIAGLPDKQAKKVLAKAPSIEIRLDHTQGY